jgi:hypothetical protein
MGILLRIFLCIFTAGVFLYSFIDSQNKLTRLRLQIPVLAKDIREIKEANTQLKYEIELFESPQHLLELARNAEYSHLKQPLLKEIITLPQGVALEIASEEKLKVAKGRPRLTLPIGAKQP